MAVALCAFCDKPYPENEVLCKYCGKSAVDQSTIKLSIANGLKKFIKDDVVVGPEKTLGDVVREIYEKDE